MAGSQHWAEQAKGPSVSVATGVVEVTTATLVGGLGQAGALVASASWQRSARPTGALADPGGALGVGGTTRYCLPGGRWPSEVERWGQRIQK